MNNRDTRRAFTQSQRNEILAQQDSKCAICHKKLDPRTIEFHHIKAYSANGRTTIRNGAALCPNCHSLESHHQTLKKVERRYNNKTVLHAAPSTEFPQAIGKSVKPPTKKKGTRANHHSQDYLPLKLDYEKAISLHLKNTSRIQIGNVMLKWKPYYRISYEVRCSKPDPRKQKHLIEADGIYIIDGLLGEFLKKSPKIVFREQTSEELRKAREDDLAIDELTRQDTETGIPSEHHDKYTTVVQNTTKSIETIRNKTIQEIIKATTRIEYYDYDLMTGGKAFKVAPEIKDVRVTSFKLIYVPLWEIELKSGENKYTRRVSGNSGKIIFDNISYCKKHGNSILDRKESLAACDICGDILCKEHIRQCPTCMSWRCATHSKSCVSCDTWYCPEHIPSKCADCGNSVCDVCASKCTICGENHCKSHMTKCSKCQKIVCTSCTRKEGGILSFGQKVLCKNC